MLGSRGTPWPLPGLGMENGPPPKTVAAQVTITLFGVLLGVVAIHVGLYVTTHSSGPAVTRAAERYVGDDYIQGGSEREEA